MTQLGRYEILQQLATGPVADVLLARAKGLEGFTRHVVVKQIRPELASDERFVQAFLNEARIAASLHHQNIVQVYDIDEDHGRYYFAMEYVHGEDVRKLLLKVRELDTLVPIDQVVAIGAAAAAGLHHAHEQVDANRSPLGLVHRDVSPGNILIGYDGSVKLVDFGLAKPALSSAKTRTGSIAGKAPYMSPELCQGKPIDRRSD
ncbi:MAG TPA: serine/threonine-protein kinase, partial [Kofleriaceae bacterium]